VLKLTRIEISIVTIAILLFLFALFGFMNPSFFESSRPKALVLARVIEYKNEFQTKEKESFYWSNGEKMQPLQSGDSIFVNPGSQVKLRLITNDEIILNENTLITLDRTNNALDISLKAGVINSPLLTASIKIDFCGKNQSVGFKEATDLNLQKKSDCKYQISVKDGEVQVGQRKVPKKFEIESNYLFKDNTIRIKNDRDVVIDEKKLSDRDFENALTETLSENQKTKIEQTFRALENLISKTSEQISQTTDTVIQKIQETFSPEPITVAEAPSIPQPVEINKPTPIKKTTPRPNLKKPEPPKEEETISVQEAPARPAPEGPFVVLPIHLKRNYYTQTGENSHFTIFWQGSRVLRDTEYFEIEIATDAQFLTEVLRYEARENFLKVKFTLKRNDYFWRVRLKSKEVYSDWSPTAQFSIK